MDPEIGGALIGVAGTLLLCYIGVLATKGKQPANGNGKHCAEHYNLIGDISSLKTDVAWLKQEMSRLPDNIAAAVREVLKG